MTKRKITNKIQRLISLALVVVMVFAFVGCGTATEDVNVDNSGYNAGAGASADNPYTFIDDYGRTVTVTSYKRTATLIGSFADVWMSAGGSVVATANDTWTNFDLGLSSDVVNIGSILNPNVELLIASRPDFVIASCNTDSNIALMQTLENAGITVAYFDVSNFEQYLNMLDKCTMITGRRDLYKTNGTDVKEQIDTIKSRVDGSNPKILFIRTSSSSVKAKQSEGSVGGEILKDFTMIDNVSVGALYHHERYDGSGYCVGLKGEEIPLDARIIGIADAFDAMTANRVYRKQLDIDFVIGELKRCSGTQFDPKLVDILLSLIEDGTIDVEKLYAKSKEDK